MDPIENRHKWIAVVPLRIPESNLGLRAWGKFRV